MQRRRFFHAGAALAATGLLNAAEFWTAKEPADWSERDIERLLHHSPWAKEVTPQFQMSMADMGESGGGQRRGGRGGGGGLVSDASSDPGMGGVAGGGAGGGGGRGGRGGGMDTMGGGSMPAEPKALIRWETARPVREAAKKPLSKELEGMYVISVTGMRLGGGRRPADGQEGQGQNPQEQRRQAADRLKNAAQLERKGADPIHPVQVQVGQVPAGPVSYFLFQRGSQPIQESDKEVVFHIKLERMELKAKFALKDMMYKGELAL